MTNNGKDGGLLSWGEPGYAEPCVVVAEAVRRKREEITRVSRITSNMV